jgi:hypothetical protein
MPPAGPAPNPFQDRSGEWFVPRFGSPRFRSGVGLLFLPYTAMVLSYTVLGALIAPRVAWDRVLAALVIYFLGLGVAGHALDALGGRGPKPWGEAFTHTQLRSLAASSLLLAYAIAFYYMVRHAPLLLPVALLEGFFVFAYNLEWFSGRFHHDRWFAFSWGFLPVLAGYILQTNRLSLPSFLLAGAAALFSLVEIKASRPYKALKRSSGPLTPVERDAVAGYEAILKSISIGVVLLAVGLGLARGALG